jgi:CHAT domain-containing protein
VKSYYNFDLELAAWSRDDAGRESLSVRVTHSKKGDQKRSEETVVSFDAAFRDACAALSRRELDLAGIFVLGRQLGDLLLPPPVRHLYEGTRDKLDVGEGLRLRLKLDNWAIADIPWEFAWLPPARRGGDEADAAGFLALNPLLSIVRYEPLTVDVETLQPVKEQKLRMVAVFSTPQGDPDWPQLALDAEARGLEKALAERPEIELVERRDATLQDLAGAIEEGAHMFHFAGHGRFVATLGERIGETVGKGYLILRDAAGRADQLAADELVVNLQDRGVRLAVLGACEGARRDAVNPWTGIAPSLVRGGLPAVVAMQATMRDDSAVAFSTRFYRALAEGRPIDAAVAAGRLAVFNQGGAAERDWGTPVLYLRAESGVLFPVVSEEEEAAKPLGRVGWVNVGLSTAGAALLVAAFYLFAHPRFPESWLIGGGVSFATIGGAALAWLMWIAGDDVRRWLRRLLRKRAVMAGLAGVAIAAGGATYALARQTHAALRVLPGVSLLSCLPGSGGASNAQYSLRVWQSERAGEPTWSVAPLRQPGAVLGTSKWVALMALERGQEQVALEMTQYLKTTPMAAKLYPQWLDLWHLTAADFENWGSPSRRRGAPLSIEIVHNGTPVPTQVRISDPVTGDDGEVSIEVVVVDLKEPTDDC